MKIRAVFFIFLFLAACGIKGPPLPPLSEEAAKKQKAESVTVKTTTPTPAASSDATSGAPAKKKTNQ